VEYTDERWGLGTVQAGGKAEMHTYRTGKSDFWRARLLFGSTNIGPRTNVPGIVGLTFPIALPQKFMNGFCSLLSGFISLPDSPFF